MLKRLLDIAVACIALVAAAPVLLVAAVGIALTSPGPVLYRARRIGRDRRQSGASRYASERRKAGYGGREFTMYKLRTMRVQTDAGGPPITARHDVRVFRVGAWLRAAKIDELPQFLNIITGDMSLVGPRPEDPGIVRAHYSAQDLTTLKVRPGLTSPGTIYYYTHCEATLPSNAAVDTYVRHVLPIKLALDRVYVRRASIIYDIRLLFGTVGVILRRSVGNTTFSAPRELREARAQHPSGSWADPSRHDGRQR